MRELNRAEVKQVSGGFLGIGALIGGVVGAISHVVSGRKITFGSMALAVGEGALTGAFGGAAGFWGRKAAAATFTYAKHKLRERSNRYALAAAASATAGGLGQGYIFGAQMGSGGSSS